MIIHCLQYNYSPSSLMLLFRTGCLTSPSRVLDSSFSVRKVTAYAEVLILRYSMLLALLARLHFFAVWSLCYMTLQNLTREPLDHIFPCTDREKILQV